VKVGNKYFSFHFISLLERGVAMAVALHPHHIPKILRKKEEKNAQGFPFESEHCFITLFIVVTPLTFGTIIADLILACISYIQVGLEVSI
jgi:hypothetical protein